MKPPHACRLLRPGVSELRSALQDAGGVFWARIHILTVNMLVQEGLM